MATRVGLVQSGAPSSSFSTTIATSATIDYQIGDFIVAFARCNATSTQTINSVALTSGGLLASVGSPSPINIATRTTVSAWYKVMTAAATGDIATATFSSGVDFRGLDVIVYRPGAGGTLALDSAFGSNSAVYGVTTNTTSPINTTGGGVLCAFVGGTYGDFNSPGPTVSSGYTKIGADTIFSAISEKFPSSSLSSESVTWTYSLGNGMSFSVAFDIAIKETIAATIYDTASLSRGIGRGIARGIA